MHSTTPYLPTGSEYTSGIKFWRFVIKNVLAASTSWQGGTLEAADRQTPCL